MAASSPYKIMLDDGIHYLVDEGVIAAANAPTPGQLLDWSSGSLIIHNTAADVDVQAKWAVENDKIGRDLNTAYAAAETCYFVYAHSGARVYAWLVTGANVARGAALEAAGNGALQALTTGRIIAYADQAVNNSGGGSGPNGSARIYVRAA